MNENTKNKVTTDSKLNNNNTKNNSNNSSNKSNLNQSVDKRSLYYALDQYLRAFSESPQGYDSYDVLVSLGSLPIGASKLNGFKESKLIKNFADIANDDFENNLSEYSQGNSFHVFLKNFNVNNAKYRIYLNCQNRNIATIAEQFFKYANVILDNYCFKIMTNESCEYSERTEKIVFYTDNKKHLIETIALLNEIKKRNPNLFIGSENNNPFFFTSHNFLKIAKELPANKDGDYIYKNLQGQEYPIVDSANTALSIALYDSLIDSINKLLTNDAEFYEYTKAQNHSDEMAAFAYSPKKLLPKIMRNKKLYTSLLSNMNQDLVKLCKLNPDLCVNGITKNFLLEENNRNKVDKDYDD